MRRPSVLVLAARRYAPGPLFARPVECPPWSRVRSGPCLRGGMSPRAPGGSGGVRDQSGTDPVFKFGRDGLVVAEVGCVFDRLGILVYLDQAPKVIDPDDLDWHQGGVGPEETHLHPDVRSGVPLVDKDVVNPADPFVVPVVDVVLFAAAF